MAEYDHFHGFRQLGRLNMTIFSLGKQKQWQPSTIAKLPLRFIECPFSVGYTELAFFQITSPQSHPGTTIPCEQCEDT